MNRRLQAAILSGIGAATAVAAKSGDEWPVYGGSSAGDRYSSLTQITPANVRGLAEVWRFTMDEPGDPETNPLIIGRMLYAYTPTLKVIALDAATGRLRWKFDAGMHGTPRAPGMSFTGPSRGLAYWPAAPGWR